MDTITVSTTHTRRRVLTLPVSELAMLMRFALLAELHGEAVLPERAHPAVELAFASYGRALGAGTLQCWWPVLREFAGDVLRARRGS